MTPIGGFRANLKFSARTLGPGRSLCFIERELATWHGVVAKCHHVPQVKSRPRFRLLFLWTLSARALPVHSTLPNNLNLAQSPVLGQSADLRIWAWAPVAGFKTALQAEYQEKPQGENSASCYE